MTVNKVDKIFSSDLVYLEKWERQTQKKRLTEAVTWLVVKVLWEYGKEGMPLEGNFYLVKGAVAVYSGTVLKYRAQKVRKAHAFRKQEKA